MDIHETPSNRSGNRPFADVLAIRLNRRTALSGGLASAAVVFIGGQGVATASGTRRGGHHGGPSRSLVGFQPVAVADGGGPVPSISPDYQYQVIIPWGEPILPPYPAHVNGSKTAADQERQIGIGHDGMWFFAHRGRSDRGLLCINHEYGTNEHVFGASAPRSLDDVRLSQAAHGVSVVELKERHGSWSVVRGNRNRRIHVNTPVEFSGPVTGHPLLGDPNRPSFGTVNNCSSGPTPWGTYVTCEENFNGYFGDASGGWVPSGAQSRYGFSAGGFGYGWEDFDPRFDLSDAAYAGEDNRFGWVVEIDPDAPDRAPVKRTALGRFKHEGVAFTTGRGGRLVGYMGDDEAGDYVYKYVSAGNWKSMRARGTSPLDEGALFVARFDDDGTGEWLELTIDDPRLAAAFADQAEVLTYARLAADALGATPMDRPEWTSIAPDGDVFCTLTNNSGRTVPNGPNPLAPNPDGHIIRWRDHDRHVGTTFEWDIFIIAESTHGTEDTFSDPDGIWADPDGRLFIETDGGQKDGLNNQLLVVDVETGDLRRLLTGVTGDEITGLTVTPDRRTLFCNTQHPGNGDPSATNFPVPNATPDGVTVPRDATFVVTRRNGGIVGS